MKLESYSVVGPCKPLWTGYAVIGTEGNASMPILYLRRPKAITDDSVWKAIVESLHLSLPDGFEIK